MQRKVAMSAEKVAMSAEKGDHGPSGSLRNKGTQGAVNLISPGAFVWGEWFGSDCETSSPHLPIHRSVPREVGWLTLVISGPRS